MTMTTHQRREAQDVITALSQQCDLEYGGDQEALEELYNIWVRDERPSYSVKQMVKEDLF